MFENNSIRHTIADCLGKSWRDTSHVTEVREITVNRLQESKADLDNELDVDLSLHDPFLTARSQTSQTHPDFNTTLEDDEHIRYNRIEIATAQDTDRGLISPVLRNVDGKSFTDIARLRAELVEQALTNKLSPDRLDGGTCTVTNLRTRSVSSFTPIINPPQVAILGIAAIPERPAQPESGDIEFNDVMTVSLSFHHRVVDGTGAAHFLETFDECLSNPPSTVVTYSHEYYH